MRVILDTNVLLSGLLNSHGKPAELLAAWRRGQFDLVTSAEQLLEFADVVRRPVLRARLVPSHVGRFINDLRELALVIQRLRAVNRSMDPADSFLLAMADASRADYLVSGDRAGVLALVRHGSTRILGVSAFQVLICE